MANPVSIFFSFLIYYYSDDDDDDDGVDGIASIRIQLI